MERRSLTNRQRDWIEREKQAWGPKESWKERALAPERVIKKIKKNRGETKSKNIVKHVDIERETKTDALRTPTGAHRDRDKLVRGGQERPRRTKRSS